METLQKKHGFMPGKSVKTNLFQLSLQVTESLHKGKQVDTIYLDLSKAFDCVDHQMLLNKLLRIGFSGLTLDWFHSYLSDRFQAVLVNGHCSNPITVTSGVAQGSRSALLFAIFINDITNCILQYRTVC